MMGLSGARKLDGYGCFGLKMEEVPLDHLQWLSGTDLEEDLRYTIERYLNF